jgi:flagellin
MSVINTNMQAIIGARNLNNSQALLGKSLNRLSSGSKIVDASDDAAGLAVSEKLTAQNRRVRAAQVNVQNAISYVQTADGFMGGMTKILARMSELGILAKDVTKNTSDIALYQEEFGELQRQLRDTIGGSSSVIGGSGVTTPLGTFNGISLFGTANGGGYQITIGEAVGQTMTVRESNLQTGDMLSIIGQDASGNFNISLTGTTVNVIDVVSKAIQQVATERSTLGAAQSRLSLATSTLDIEYENLSAAISRIQDVDVAQETTTLARYNILTQSGTAMLAQANQMPSSVLKLLNG